MKEYKVTQTALAAKIGCTDSMLSRFLSGKTDKLSDENIIRIARAFNVSTDFLLGITDVPDRKNYEISELGLSAQAARNLYTEKVNAEVVNRLLESPRFAELTYMIKQYFDDTLAVGFAAQNTMISSVSSLLRGTVATDAAVQAARDINRLKVPVYQADLSSIQNQFMVTIKEVKKEIGSDLAAAQSKTEEITKEMFAKLTKGQDMRHLSITPEQVADAITGTVSGMDGVNEDSLKQFKYALVDLMQSSMQPPPRENNHADQ
ncbi:MAG: helix-turn-helix domain-containing protein [Lachnospiraceae bacterium]|nr:helix-turn-helix domain-containing protein [Lachnospiraceae bacterium]